MTFLRFASSRRALSFKGSRARGAAFVSLALFTSSVLAALVVACGSSSSSPSTGGTPGTNGEDSSVGTPGFDAGPPPPGNLLGDGATGSTDGGAYADGPLVLPDNFVPTEQGGYALGPPITNGEDGGGLIQSGSSNCSLVVGIVRDFHSYGIETNGHPDFERFGGTDTTPGLVQSALGTDLKPVYNNECDNSGSPNPPCLFGQELTTVDNFNEWYRYAAGVNLPYLVYFQFVPKGNVYTFQSNAYFPLDDAGFGNTTGLDHNFSFTTEVHLTFVYNGGETFSFTGDDDLWVFINGKLAIDLGGLHTPVNKSVSLDTLGLTKGSQYPLDLFNAERHSTGSNFQVDTNLSFTSCGSLPPDVPK